MAGLGSGGRGNLEWKIDPSTTPTPLSGQPELICTPPQNTKQHLGGFNESRPSCNMSNGLSTGYAEQSSFPKTRRTATSKWYHWCENVTLNGHILYSRHGGFCISNQLSREGISNIAPNIPLPLLHHPLPFHWTTGCSTSIALTKRVKSTALLHSHELHKPTKATKRETHRTTKLKLRKLRKHFITLSVTLLAYPSKAWPCYAR